ncbi:uncharacterized protein LOC143883809 isoform X1 [Tasmannia lanceolata]|uniref:uncharacterized protein LOC143883809 isoform X1 n=2 Tax=Tasmannia lanceolata TaxID=3420 RepID=UPI0040628307
MQLFQLGETVSLLAGCTMLHTGNNNTKGRAVSNVSKSVSVLDLSRKEKTTKPPRRLSIPAKSSVSPLPRSVSNITPISEIRTKKSTRSQGNCDTPASDASKSTNRRKFSVLSSFSYWISQIKISESAAKHSISLGLFKLALESGCEPFQPLRDELKSYVLRHNLLELGEPTKELLRSYNISEDLEQVQVSETCSLVLESSDEDGHSTSTARAGNLKPKSLNSENIRASVVGEAIKNEGVQKRTAVKNRAPVNKSSSNFTSVVDNRNNLQKKSQRPTRQDTNRDKGKVKNSETKFASEKDSGNPTPNDETQQDDKENLGASQLEEISLTVE